MTLNRVSTLNVLPEILTNPPRRRLGCLALVLDEAARVLLLDPEYKAGFILPGGSAEAGEAPNEAVARHVHTKTGLVLDLWQIVAVDYEEKGELPEGVNLVFYGGVLPQRRVDRVKVPPAESDGITGVHWVPQSELHQVTEPDQRARITNALRAVEQGAGLPMLLRGQPAGE